MNHNTPFRLRRTIVLGLVVATAIGTTSAVAATTGQFSPPAGATLEPAAASTGQFSPPAGATLEPAAAPTGQFSPPAGATLEPTAASTVQPRGVQIAPVPSISVVELRGGLDWADAGIGAGIAFGGILLLGGALLMVRRSGQRHRLATL